MKKIYFYDVRKVLHNHFLAKNTKKKVNKIKSCIDYHWPI